MCFMLDKISFKYHLVLEPFDDLQQVERKQIDTRFHPELPRSYSHCNKTDSHVQGGVV